MVEATLLHRVWVKEEEVVVLVEVVVVAAGRLAKRRKRRRHGSRANVGVERETMTST